MKWSDSGGKEFEQAAAGNHVARCIGMIDIGTQENSFEGKTTYARKIVLRFELPNEVMQDGDYAGKPFIVGKYYTASLSEKANLRKDLESWRGRPFTQEELMGFDSKNVLDKPCMLNVVHTDKKKAKIASIAPVPKGLEIPPRVNDILYLSLERDEFKRDVFEGLSDYWKGEIMKSPEWAELAQAKPTTKQAKHFDEMESDIPF